MRWSPRLSLNTPKWKMILEANLPASFYMRAVCHNICHMFVFSPEYTWSSKVKKMSLSTLMKQIDGQCLCSSLSVISDYAITGSTPYCICESGELIHFAWCRIYALVGKLDQLWFRQWLAACSAPGHYQSHPGLLSIIHVGINFSEIRIKNISFMKMHSNILSEI